MDTLKLLAQIDKQSAENEFGTFCQRFFPSTSGDETFGGMACWIANGLKTDPDIHNQRELIVVLRGSGTLYVGSGKTSLQAGDVYLVEKNIQHVLEADNETELHWISLYWPLYETGA